MKKRLVVWVFFIILSLTLSLEPSFALGLMAHGLGAAPVAKGSVSLGEGDLLLALWNANAKFRVQQWLQVEWELGRQAQLRYGLSWQVLSLAQARLRLRVY